MTLKSGIIAALLAAVLFGASTPFAKLLLGDVSPILLAGLLYGGSGAGLLLFMLARKLIVKDINDANIKRSDIGWLAGAVLAGGIVAPVLLMSGIRLIPASSAALLLNLESVFTACLAWFVFKENFDHRIFAGMICIVVAGVLLSWQEGIKAGIPWGGLLVIGACFCWGIDNNLTRKISASSSLQIAAIKGSAAGIVNLSIAFALGAAMPSALIAGQAAVVGFLGYGISLVLFVLALRHLGTARTGAYFSVAPFFGAALALLIFHETPPMTFWIAAALMGLGIWLHLTEDHAHEHTHEAMDHEHEHIHDSHHQHDHDFAWDGKEPHTHPHQHVPMTHSHEHFPDIHHRHGHK